MERKNINSKNHINDNFMKELKISDIEKMMQTKYICTQQIKLSDNVLGDNKTHILEFDIFDGFAYCKDYKGKEYYMIAPKKEFIGLSKEMENGVREFLKMSDAEPITSEAAIAAYNTLFINE